MINPLDPLDPTLKRAAKTFERFLMGWGGKRPWVVECLDCGYRQPVTREELRRYDKETCPNCGERLILLKKRWW